MGQALAGYIVLVVENEYFIASDTAESLARAGATILGPCATVAAAVRLIEETSPSHAVLDLNLDGSGARFELARQLQSRKVKSVIVSGYDKGTLPNDLAGIPFLMKPVSYGQLVEVFAALPAAH
ncbi:hypothetical protein QP166_12870 [Sphingomonas sp. LR60]|uniref:response regulator n=1 Tax=Sphingomonas sp. LR60 TaxID=3050233 RepID=UPI002FE0E7E7